ncbi:MAG: hypothetical protein J5517_00175 [Eubacterium sp.]|nr:hypothetical protein [Eubacterium sp.]
MKKILSGKLKTGLILILCGLSFLGIDAALFFGSNWNYKLLVEKYSINNVINYKDEFVPDSEIRTGEWYNLKVDTCLGRYYGDSTMGYYAVLLEDGSVMAVKVDDYEDMISTLDDMAVKYHNNEKIDQPVRLHGRVEEIDILDNHGYFTYLESLRGTDIPDKVMIRFLLLNNENDKMSVPLEAIIALALFGIIAIALAVIMFVREKKDRKGYSYEEKKEAHASPVNALEKEKESMRKSMGVSKTDIKKVELYPLDKLVINDIEIKLGSNKQDVIALLGLPDDINDKSGDDSRRHYYYDSELAFDYDSEGNLEFIEFLAGHKCELKPFIYDVSVFDTPKEKLLAILFEKNNGEIDEEEAPKSYAFIETSVGIREDKKIGYWTSIGIGVKDYYKKG